MTDKIETARGLLALLKGAAKTNDYSVAAETLERMLQPWGLHLMEPAGVDRDRFTTEDKRMLGNFWHLLLDLRADETDILVRAATPFMCLLSASIAREYVAVQEMADALCRAIVNVCSDLPSGEEAPVEEFKTRNGKTLRVVG